MTEQQSDINESDIRVDVFNAAVAGAPYRVRITHLPSGKGAEATDASQIRARDAAFADLQRAVAAS